MELQNIDILLYSIGVVLMIVFLINLAKFLLNVERKVINYNNILSYRHIYIGNIYNKLFRRI